MEAMNSIKKSEIVSLYFAFVWRKVQVVKYDKPMPNTIETFKLKNDDNITLL